MNIILFAHPLFLSSQSMPRFAKMLMTEYRKRGHQVAIWSPTSFFHKILARTRFAKWAGYVDQYLIFPAVVRFRILRQPADTLFVFSDQALGPWVRTVQHRPHIVHAHDLLALKSSLGLIPENPTSKTGRIYQQYILRGFRNAKHFIAVSGKTKADLMTFGHIPADKISVVYNGLNYDYQPISAERAQSILTEAGLQVAHAGFLLHVGGNQWYKNTKGVVALYKAYVQKCLAAGKKPLPLVMISPPPSPAVQKEMASIPSGGSVIFKQGVGNHVLQALYSTARVLLFPSLAEGFGWPIVEAQACGCLVLTTDEAPMNEIGGTAPAYIPKLTSDQNVDAWAEAAYPSLDELLICSDQNRSERIQSGLVWTKQFRAEKTIDAYLSVYMSLLEGRSSPYLSRPS